MYIYIYIYIYIGTYIYIYIYIYIYKYVYTYALKNTFYLAALGLGALRIDMYLEVQNIR
jgi:hypothetical protein